MRRFRRSLFVALATTEQGLSSELVIYVVFDPAAHKDQLPEGLRFRTLEEYAARVHADL